MTDIIQTPVAPVVPPYPALGAANFNQEAYAYGSSMPGVSYRIWEIGQAAEQNARYVQSQVQAAEDASASATQQADAAMGYRNQASNYADAAGVSAGNAAASASAAGNALVSMQTLYLGAKTSIPTTDNAGRALQVGCWYTYTGSDPVLKGWHWWDGSAWQMGVGNVGDSFVSKIAGFFDGSAAMSDAAVQSCGIYAAPGGGHGPDWPKYTPGSVVGWVVQTYGDPTCTVQKAQLASDTGIHFERSKIASKWGDWVQVITSRAFMERSKLHDIAGGAFASVTLNPAEGSVQTIALTAGALTLNLVTPRQVGDQITVCIQMSGGAWPLTFGSNIKPPTSEASEYSSGQELTLVFQAMHVDKWNMYYGGVHAV